ncbi:MAG: TfoX/Sxy family protein [Perlucidibaca sp.]
MSVHAGFAATLTDLFAQALRGPVRCKRMFGGFGFYHDDRFFAVMVDGTPYLKVDAGTRPAFEAAGLPAWVYLREGRPVTMGFHGLPEAALDDPEEMRPWVLLALQAARRTTSPGTGRRRGSRLE